VQSHRIETAEAWKTFERSVDFVTDPLKKSRLLALVTFCNGEGGILKAAALDIRYHKDCWRTQCRPVWHEKACQKATSNAANRSQLVSALKLEAFTLLCKDLTEALGENKEVYTLRDILMDYEEIQRSLSLSDDEIRNTCNDRVALAALHSDLQLHFGTRIAFQTRYQRNRSSIVFFPEHGGAYVESAINSWGIKTLDLIKNITKELHEKHKLHEGVPWPCHVSELNEDKTPDDIHNFIALIADPTSEIQDGRVVVSDQLQSSVRCLAEGILHLITKKRQPLQIMLSMACHNLTGNKSLICALKKMKIGISYDDVLDLLAAWAHHESSLSNSLCPIDILLNSVGIVMMDNDDFKEDGLTGAETSHFTNVMMAQSLHVNTISGNITFGNAHQSTSESALVIPSSVMRKNLADNASSQVRKCYGTRVEPKPSFVDTSLSNAVVYRLTAHALFQCLCKDVPIPAYTGYHCQLFDQNKQWKTFNIKSHSQPPSKEVVKEVMTWCQEVAVTKNMPLIALAADQAIYKYIEELLCEDTARWSRVKGILGGFHTECSFLNAIGKRYEASSLEELAVVSGAISAGSARKALLGKHYSRGMRIHKLMFVIIATYVILFHCSLL
jgi:hypothetical protein